MGFWRSLRQWWCWDGNPEAYPFRDRRGHSRSSDEIDDESGDVHGHARAEGEPGPSDDDEPGA
jgi:hypothetical protein